MEQLIKAAKGTPQYDEWLRKYREKRGAKAKPEEASAGAAKSKATEALQKEKKEAKSKQEDLMHPEVMGDVKKSLKKFCTLKPSISDSQLEIYWSDFSDIEHGAGYLEYDEEYVEEFADWLKAEGHTSNKSKAAKEPQNAGNKEKSEKAAKEPQNAGNKEKSEKASSASPAKTLAKLRASKEWQNPEYLESRKELLEANKLQAEVALNRVLDNYHADIAKNTITEWYEDVPAEEVAEAIETDCPGIKATVVSDDQIRVSTKKGWSMIPKSQLSMGEFEGE